MNLRIHLSSFPQVGRNLNLLLVGLEREQLVDAVYYNIVLHVSDLLSEDVHVLTLQTILVGVDDELLGPEKASTGASLLVKDGPGGAD